MIQNRFLRDEGSDWKVLHMTGIYVMPYEHIHPQWELYFCPQKVMQRSVINGMEYTYCHPCAIISKPYTVHSMSCLETDETNYERFVFYFTEKTLLSFNDQLFSEQWMGNKLGMFFELTEEQADYLCRLLHLVDDKAYPLTKTEWELIFGFFINKLFDFCGKDKISKVGDSTFYVQDVMRYISEHLSEPLTVKDIALRFAVSRSKLDRDFKNLIGMTVHDFTDLCRLNYAKLLLHDTKTPSMSAVAEACGFENSNYFFTFFKKHVGVSPAEFRRIKENSR